LRRRLTRSHFPGVSLACPITRVPGEWRIDQPRQSDSTRLVQVGALTAYAIHLSDLPVADEGVSGTDRP
jgi:hypothetical protein